MTIDEIRDILLTFIPKYSIKKMILFGSRADGTNDADSDVDLIIEFSTSVSLITLSQIKIDMEDALGLDVDIVHGPISDKDILEINKEVVLYAA
ncbi:MAG: nucleotidyltransferase domain-containing protein [Lachnospiraceae bacterium]|nr:nucleotidyltransferase domain-containing protein [Lachnospiraceae bacterium]